MATELKTSMSEGKRAGCSLFVTLILFGMAAGFYFGGDEGPGPDLFQVAALLPGLLALLMLYSGIHALFGIRTPETTITIGANRVRRGEPVEIQLHQPGPLKLSSLRVNVVSEEVKVHRVRQGKRDRRSTYPYQENQLDFGPVEILQGESKTLSGTILIPRQFEPSLGEPGSADSRLISRTVSWRLEVWGKVEKGADFMRPFEIEVV